MTFLVTPVLRHLMAPWKAFLQDLSLVEIMAVKPGELILEHQDGSFVSYGDGAFTLKYWESLIHTLANEQELLFAPPEQGLLAARLPDEVQQGYHRFEAMWGERVQSGISVSVRLKRFNKRTFQDFGISSTDRASLKDSLKEGACVLISGGTSSGKTSLLDLLVAQIPLEKRIITIEDTPELSLPHPNWVSYRVPRYSTSRHLTYQSLIDHVVRMRPDILITGEISVDNCFPILRLLNTGHKGFMTTIHANSPQNALDYAFQQNLVLCGYESFQSGPYLRTVVDTVLQVDKQKNGQRHVTHLWHPQRG